MIILFVIIAAGTWWLYHNKWTMDREARAFGRQMIERVALNHDLAFFRDNLGPQARLDNPPSQQELVIGRFRELGVPQQPIKIEENVTFERSFFSPKGYFLAHLFYPTQELTVQVAISHPVGKWQLDNLTAQSGPAAP